MKCQRSKSDAGLGASMGLEGGLVPPPHHVDVDQAS